MNGLLEGFWDEFWMALLSLAAVVNGLKLLLKFLLGGDGFVDKGLGVVLLVVWKGR